MGGFRSSHIPSKRLGQNFLIAPGIAEEIVGSISPRPTDVVLEPGPGHGTLTRILVQKAGNVIAIEKDPALVDELRQSFRDKPNLTVLQGDLLKMGESLPSFNKLVSTPPYYISSKLTLFLTGRKFDVAAVVFQKEFCDRLLAKPGTSDYGRLTVMARRKLDVEKLRDISRRVFRPVPKVDSTLLIIRPKHRVSEIDELIFEEMVRGIFSQRRRLLKSALLHFLELRYGRELAKQFLTRMSVPDLRVYQLPIPELENLSLRLWSLLTERLESSDQRA